MEDLVLVDHRDGVVEITLNRPDVLNSFNEAMHGQLGTAFDRALKEKAGCVLLTGAGRAFCAGQDLTDGASTADATMPDLSEILNRLYHPLLAKIRALPCPVVCAVNGVAAGAGANVALACDVVFAAHSAKFIQAFSKVGLVPDAGGTWTLTRHLGPARAKALALSAQPLSAVDAEAWGLIWKSVPDNELMTVARQFAKDRAEGPALANALTKRAIDAASTQSFEEQLTMEAEFQNQCGDSPDFKEGVNAFLEKRPPIFSRS